MNPDISLFDELPDSARVNASVVKALNSNISDLSNRVGAMDGEVANFLRSIERSVEREHAEEIRTSTERFEEIVNDLQRWKEQAADLWDRLAATLRSQQPDLSGVEVPKSKAPGETDRFVLFDSRRDTFTQLDHYHAWRDGDE